MAKAKKFSESSDFSEELPALRPATTVEGRENQLISLAIDLAAKQLREGTASSQVITHFLKLGTTNAQLEKEKLIHENELLKAKTDAIESQKRIEELYSEAMRAMKDYTMEGSYSEDDIDDEDICYENDY